MSRTRPVVSILSAFATGLALASAVAAQIPERFTNLQVLPEEIARGELVGLMRSFTFATGLRCSSCHVGEEGQPLESYDFASDDKASKRKAREMIRMVQAINDTYLAAVPDRTGIRVRCVTCHHGVRRPEDIETIITRVAEEEGVSAAIQRYRDLRDEYYGSAAYDFRERPVVNAADARARVGDVEGAVALLEMITELEDETWASWFTLGRLHEQRGDVPAAIDAYQRSLAQRPDNPVARARLEALRGA
jgi:tetratricopeptide (TPR) repeat protein